MSNEGVWVVKIPGPRSFVSSSSSDTVADVKAKIQDQGGVSVEEQCLIFEGRELDDGVALASCKAPAAGKPTLYLLSRGLAGSRRSSATPVPGDFKGVRVSVIGGGEGFSVEAQQTDTVGSLKEKICQQLGTPVSQQRLIFLGAELSDTQTLGAQGVSTPAAPTLHVLLERPPEDQAEDICVGESPEFQVGCLLERRIDGIWFMARVLRLRLFQGRPTAADLRYLDDGNVEKDVPLNECRVMPDTKK